MTRQPEPIQVDRSSRFALRSGLPPFSRRLPSPRAPRPGAVDGAWWPHTSDLVAELSNLEALLGRRAGSLDRIMYNMDAWQPAPRRTMIGGRSVRLDGYRHLPTHTLCVLGLDRTRLVLLVIPAHGLDHTQNEAALRRWDDEGGHPAPMDPADPRASVARSPALTGGLI